MHRIYFRKSKSPPSGRGTRHDFSLVELLVVVSIIIILIGILLPALNKVRSTAQRIQCVSNMKQLAVAAISYVSSSESESFPGLDTFTYATNDKYSGLPNYLRVATAYSNSEKSLIQCPSFIVDPVKYNTHITNGRKATFSCYGPTMSTDEENDGTYYLSSGYWATSAVPNKYSRIKQESVLFTEKIPQSATWIAYLAPIPAWYHYYPWNNTTSYHTTGPSVGIYEPDAAGGYMRHQLKSNYAFVDGHVETLSRSIKFTRWYKRSN